MNSRAIVARFEEWRARSEPMVLVTVFETIGSTYSKAGHRILIAGDGDYQGLVSGGCLEGDLVERARAVIAAGRAAAVTYDLRDDADELFGLGIGCNGLLRMLLQPVTADTDFEPFASIAACLTGEETAAVATVVESGSHGAPAGASLIRRAGASRGFGVSGALAALLEPACDEAIRTEQARTIETGAGVRALAAPIVPVPRLLVLGAGVDAVPLVRMAGELGWRVTVADHRPAYVERGGFGAAEEVLLVDPGSLADRVDPGRFDAIVVMSHHLATDRAYLEQLAAAPARYIGVLGPAARRQRLLDDLGAAGRSLGPRLEGPVGLDIGADSPESIALSILAEIQQRLSRSVRRPAGSPDADQ